MIVKVVSEQGQIYCMLFQWFNWLLLILITMILDSDTTCLGACKQQLSRGAIPLQGTSLGVKTR